MKIMEIIDKENSNFNKENDKEITISPERQKAFIEFIRSLPRITSPTLLEISDTSIKCSSSSSFKSSDTEKNNLFDWSIEEYSAFYGKDFSNHDEQMQFDSLLNTCDSISKEFDDENEKFFSQEKILSSPLETKKTNNQSINLCNDIISGNTAGSFIRLIDSIPYFSNDHSKNSFSKNQSFIESAIGISDNSLRNESNNQISCEKIEKSNLNNNQRDSDFVSMKHYNDKENQESMEWSLCSTIDIHSDEQMNLSFTEKSMKCTPKITYRYDFGFNNHNENNNENSTPKIISIDDISGISPIMSITNAIEMNKENSPLKSNNNFKPKIDTIKKRALIHSRLPLSSSSSIIHSTILLNNHQYKEHVKNDVKTNNDENIVVDNCFKTPQTTTRIRRKRISRAKLFFTNEINAQSTPNNNNNNIIINDLNK